MELKTKLRAVEEKLRDVNKLKMSKEERKLIEDMLMIARDKKGRGVLLAMIDITLKSLEDKDYTKKLRKVLDNA
jgi:hypothetical protein